MKSEDKTEILMQQYERAVVRRRLWESLWDECYGYTFSSRQNFTQSYDNKGGSGSQIYDATAPDAAEQLAASLLGELTPPFGKWLELSASPAYESQYGGELTAALEEAQDVFHEHLQKSNFLLEMQQAFLDSVVIGTSVLSFSENTEMGSQAISDSVFQFSALPLQQIYVCEGNDGRLSHVFRRSDLSLSDLRHRFEELSEDNIERLEHSCVGGDFGEEKFSVIEAVTLCDEGGYDYHALLHGEGSHGASLLRQGHYQHNPFIAFRWMKMPSEDYGRSPIMKLLPDIKTANKVVELILKNAAIEVTGIWQADDDGVLNPSKIKLAPGVIIPKAVGSQGLTPLQPSADFTLSQDLLDQLRIQIRKGLLYNELNPSFSPVATATEVLEKSDRASRIMGATYGRMQSELLLPLAYRGLDILKRRGLIAPLPIDGVNIRVKIQSPLARRQRLNQVQNVIQFVDYASRLRDSFADVDSSELLSWLARQMEVPQNILPQFPSISPVSELALLPNDTSNLKEKNHA